MLTRGVAIGWVVILTLAALGSGFLLGFDVRNGGVTAHTLPVRAVVTLPIDGDVAAPQSTPTYATNLAAGYLARLTKPGLRLGWPPSDLQVTPQRPPCRGRGCGNYAGLWSFQFRSASTIDSQAVRLALGRGDLTIRSVMGAAVTACAGTGTSEPDSVAITAAYVPESEATKPCAALGPLVRRLSNTSDIPAAVEPPAYGIKSRLLFTLSSSDATWLQQYAAANKTGELALLCDGWILNTISVNDVNSVDRLSAVPVYEPQTVVMPAQVADGLAIAIDSSSSPLPVPSPMP